VFVLLTNGPEGEKEILHIDGDIISYRAAASCEPTKVKPYLEPLSKALMRQSNMMNKIFDACGTNEFRAYISGENNFRYLIYPEYKANRKKPKPTHYWECVGALLDRGAEMTDGYEADDAIGIHCEEGDFIVSIDKDLLQIPGRHYNFVNDILHHVDEDSATLSYWADNIVGIRGVGPVNALRYLEGLSVAEMEETVRELYDDDIRFNINRKLLRILRSEEEYAERLKEIHEAQFSQAEGQNTPTVCQGQDPGQVPAIGEG
jgi:5'-3' exonuclease